MNTFKALFYKNLQTTLSPQQTAHQLQVVMAQGKKKEM